MSGFFLFLEIKGVFFSFFDGWAGDGGLVFVILFLAAFRGCYFGGFFEENCFGGMSVRLGRGQL